MDAADSLAAVVPPERRLRIGGADYTLRPVSLGQLPRVITALRPFVDHLLAGQKLDTGNPEQFGKELLAALLDYPLSLVDALVAVSGLERKVVESADLAEAADLLTALIDLNADFFARAVAPKLGGALAAAGSAIPAMPMPGPTLSSA